MTFSEFQKDCLRTANPALSNDDKILNAALGIGGESGEILDLVKKFRYQGHRLNIVKVIEEVGDTLYYLASLCDALGMQLGMCANYNTSKLKIRYPDGFTVKDSVERRDKDLASTEISASSSKISAESKVATSPKKGLPWENR